MGKAKSKKRIKCLTCNNRAQSRGLCWKCHTYAMGLIDRGEETDESLVSRGLINAAKRVGRPPNGAFAAALAKSKQKRKSAAK